MTMEIKPQPLEEKEDPQVRILRVFNSIISRVEDYHPDPDLKKLRAAFEYAQECHKGQKRKSGEPYVLHPVEVASIVADLKLGTDSLCAGLLHDVLEDTDATLQDLKDRFGIEVASLVDGLTKISKFHFDTQEEQQAESFRKMLLAMSRDLRVLLVKLCDRVHNMRTLQYMPPEKQQRIAQETLDIYTPLANRLGISWIKIELEDLSFRFLHRERYDDLVEKVAMAKEERQHYIEEVIGILNRVLQRNHLKDYDLQGRHKHLFSLYRKLERSGIEFDQVYDMLAFRIVTSTIGQCYEALGIVHNLWKPIPGRFKDYIALPKSNRYQSLHTSVLGPYRRRIEIQIRTHEMHRINEDGIAAHWMYKEGKAAPGTDDRVFAWLRQLMVWQQDLSDPQEFINTVKIDLFADEVYVFTPKGSLRSFPKGATPVDFAYAVHTEVGSHCIGAKVNGQIVPLKYQMRNGDILEIITSEAQTPKRDWLQFVITGRARSKIRHFVRKEQRDQSYQMGRSLVEKTLRRKGLNLSRLEKSGALLEAANTLRCANLDEFFIHMGQGRLQPDTLVQRLLPKPAEVAEERPIVNEERVSRLMEDLKKSKSGILVGGLGDVMVRMARCCSPVPGDPIVGFITRGRGVTVHTASCPRVPLLEEARQIDCEWDSASKTSKRKRSVHIRVICEDRPGLLASITQSLSTSGINITQAHCRTTKTQDAINTFEVLVRDLSHLKESIQAILRIKGVSSAERIRL